jgi:hypothetical protein
MFYSEAVSLNSARRGVLQVVLFAELACGRQLLAGAGGAAPPKITRYWILADLGWADWRPAGDLQHLKYQQEAEEEEEELRPRFEVTGG